MDVYAKRRVVPRRTVTVAGSVPADGKSCCRPVADHDCLFFGFAHSSGRCMPCVQQFLKFDLATVVTVMGSLSLNCWS